MAITPVYGWPYQALADPPDGPELGEDLALAAETTVSGIDAVLAATISTHTVDNAALDARLDIIEGAWTDYAPAYTQLVPGVTAAVVARYKVVGKTGDVTWQITMGAGTTYGTTFWTISLPFTARSTAYTGTGMIYDNGAGQRSASAFLISTTTVILVSGSTLAGGPSTPFGWSTGDIAQFTFNGIELV